MNNNLLKEFEALKAKGLSLNLSRGRPCKEQLDLTLPMMDLLNSSSDYSDGHGVDCRAYGVLDGIEDAKQLMAEIIGVREEDVMIFGNSSLQIMYDCMINGMLYGVAGEKPWKDLEEVKWLCPVPGYDRHFAMCEHLGIKMVNIPMNENGPDMDLVEKYVQDPSVKGIWCVPIYSNPSGITYSDEVVLRFAKLKPASKDFRIYWDEAYCVHHIYEEKQAHLLELLNLAKEYGNEDLVYIFASTNKVVFAGSGLAAFAASPANLKEMRNNLQYSTIGFDKMNQLLQVRFLKNLDGVKEHMRKHAAIIRPKFDYIHSRLQEVKDLCSFNAPLGGYFISIYVPGKVEQIIARCKEAGLQLTAAGSAYPYHNDPENAHIRLAPTCITMDELKTAMDILILSIRIECEK